MTVGLSTSTARHLFSSSFRMRLAIGLAAFVGAALAWDHLLSNSTDSMKIPRYIPGAYVVEFADGHVCLSTSKSLHVFC